MQHSLQKLPKNTVQLSIELTPAEMEPHLKKAATTLNQQTTIPGFRVGHAPQEELVRRFGALRIWEEAAVIAVPKAFGEIAQKENLQTVGSPEIEVVKLAPDNPFIFKATVALIPEVSLGALDKLKIEQKPVAITDAQIDKVLEDLRRMQTKEVVVNRAARAQGDKVMVDMQMSLDSVPLDGGQTKDHAVYLDEEYYVPGLREKLQGMAKGETKEFKLKFPKEHYQKNIADREVDFKVTVKDVFELQPPEINDAFAQILGQKTITELRGLVRENLENEAKLKEEERQEIALLEKLVDGSKFGEIPELLLNEETNRMLAELEGNLARQGIKLEDYLQKIGKTHAQLRLDFAPQALKRAKTALAVRALATQENLVVTEEEVDAEVKRILDLYKNAPEQHEQIRSEGAREYLRTLLRNRKVIAYLKEKAGLAAQQALNDTKDQKGRWQSQPQLE